MTSYYDILGISKDASLDEIKRSYRRLAMTHHPDKGGDKEQFQKIQQAYETLSDTKKRGEYDNPNSIHTNSFDFSFDHPFFKHHMKQQQRFNKLQDHYYTCKIKLDDVYIGATKRLKISRKKPCKNCIKNCNMCNGEGTITQNIRMGPFTQIVQQSCQMCKAKGKITNVDENCNVCTQGYIYEEQVFEIQIKKECKTGDRFVFDQWGEQAIRDNEISGNFIVNIEIEDHPLFKKQGQDLLYNINVSFAESILGKNIIIKHFGGDIQLDTSGFGIINPFKEYVIFGKGLLYNDEKAGNLRLKFNIVYPERTLTIDDKEILRKSFQETNIE